MENTVNWPKHLYLSKYGHVATYEMVKSREDHKKEYSLIKWDDNYLCDNWFYVSSEDLDCLDSLKLYLHEKEAIAIAREYLELRKMYLDELV